MTTGTLTLKLGRRLPAAERARLGTWILCWVALPNIGFCLLWLLGAPPRTAEILGTGVLGLLVRRRSRPIQLGAFALAIAYSAASYVSAIFNLAPNELLVSVGFLMELRPTGAREYLAAALAAGVIVFAAQRALARPNDVRTAAGIALAVGAVVAMAALDDAVSRNSRGMYKRWPQPDAPFSSAVQQSGLLSRADGRRHLILIAVEAMGDPSDPALRQRLLGRWRRADIGQRYDVRLGRSPYYGSTTSAEIRELCGRWGEPRTAVRDFAGDCLPAQLRRRGYRTTAVHSFTGDMFDRASWYPQIGFERMVFRDGLIGAGAGRCSGVFPGACDRDVPRILAQRLRAAREPQFLYWLTVNSHLPVPATEPLGTKDCLERHPDFPVRNGSVCRLATVIEGTEDAVARMVLAPDFPDADVLIVGDHMPPFFDHGSRAQFDGSHVPWILLTSKGTRHVDARAKAGDAVVPPR